jgi:hypothetical protein
MIKTKNFKTERFYGTRKELVRKLQREKRKQNKNGKILQYVTVSLSANVHLISWDAVPNGN